ncbi:MULTISPECIES: hypothetical protein [Streptomyces]|uniref:Uncharacterized protein n=1 Tax=Streptomyces virginiae TaxID=1961 RepID=A0ABQ3NEK7_STRVG|nr:MULTISPECIES: hypothetical protein [Streptomyces]KOV49744.1 hypothetical protein ADK98_09295 [Streptomyces sp. H036]GLV95874.1 hypothetical protein Slala04_73270 [Streptomyces lavendulae subsp. lavendulae]KOU24560.1 hypothetical protein ADK49_07130 [Streptomyces sp. WM6349]KOU77080.1 hypothetical protein ADK94_37170 [Streptomyces sp. XY593]KOV04022.1 hypothetical protein ADK91_17040 [Streptomyces sp. XY511]
MSTVRRRTLVRAAAVTACAGSLLALPTAAALAEGVPAASSAHSAAPQRTLVKSLSLADGVSTAKVYRTAKGGYQADILASDGARATTLTSHDGVTDFGASGELHAALDPAGRLTSWVGDASARDGGHAVAGAGHKTGTRDGALNGQRNGQVVPVSAEQRAASGDTRALEAASAEGRRLSTLADGPGDGVLLLAAGGGIAAVGAAGLGFAMLRRGRTDG